MVFLWWCLCGGVFVVFLWWCFRGGVVVFLWWCFCGGVLVVVYDTTPVLLQYYSRTTKYYSVL